MDTTIIVVMLKNMETGILEREVTSCEIEENAGFIVNIFAEENESGYLAHMQLSTVTEMADWQFMAAYDYYDTEIFGSDVLSVNELDDCFDPTWELVFRLPETEAAGSRLIQKLVNIHAAEIDELMRVIEAKEDEYR